MNYDHILNQLYNTPWFTTKEHLELICSVVDRKIAGEELSEEHLAAFRSKPHEEIELPTEPSLAVLPIHGSIFPKANLLTSFSGGTSIGNLKKDFSTLMNSDKVTGILLDIDSPGGSASMIKEMADLIWEARQSGKKPIHAIANPNMHSGAYYLGSQADKIYSTPSGFIGSIGVISMHTDESARDKEEGIVRTILTVGKYKGEGNPYEPLSEGAKEHQLTLMQETYDGFVEDVARGRGTDVENVVDNFGQGRSYKVRAALKRGMIDGIKTIESVVGEMSQSRFQIAVPNNGGSKMAEVTPEILALLNLSEDATSEDVQSAIEEMASKELEVPEVEVPETNFAAQFPEHAAEIARLRQKDRVNEAKLFAGLYGKFGNDHGLSSLALTQVEELHLKIADGIITQDDLKLFLDNVASGTAVVDYRELGSTNGEDNDAFSGLEAGIKLRDLAYEKMTEEGLSYGDALSKVLTENESLAQIYRNSVSAERGES